MELWLIYALLTVVVYGGGEGLSKEPTVRLGPGRMLALYSLYSVPIYVAWFFLGGGWSTLTPTGVLLGLGSGAAGAAGTALWFIALERGNASVVSGFTAAYPVITVVAAVVGLGATLLPVQVASVALLVSGACLLGLAGHDGAAAGPGGDPRAPAPPPPVRDRRDHDVRGDRPRASRRRRAPDDGLPHGRDPRPGPLGGGADELGPEGRRRVLHARGPPREPVSASGRQPFPGPGAPRRRVPAVAELPAHGQRRSRPRPRDGRVPRVLPGDLPARPSRRDDVLPHGDLLRGHLPEGGGARGPPRRPDRRGPSDGRGPLLLLTRSRESGLHARQPAHEPVGPRAARRPLFRP